MSYYNTHQNYVFLQFVLSARSTYNMAWHCNMNSVRIKNAHEQLGQRLKYTNLSLAIA